jgi:YbbR domain-containing protein
MIKLTNSKKLLLLISFVVSIFLWFYVLNSEPLEIEKEITLVLIPPTGKAVNVTVPNKVKVKILGSRAFVQKLNFNEEKIVVDLKNYPKNKDAFAVTFDSTMLTLPFGVKVLDISPKQLMVSLDREIKKYVPVRVKLIGNIGKDLKLVQKDFSPKKIFITGPHDVIKSVGKLSTTPVDLSNLEGDGSLKVSLDAVDGRVKIKDEPVIEFRYKVKPNKANLTLKNVKIKFLTSRGRFKSSRSEVALDVLISDDRAKSIKKSEIVVIADIPDGTKGKVKIKLRAQVPEGVHLLKIHPEYINVRLN